MTATPIESGRAFWQFELNGVCLSPYQVEWGRVGELEGNFWIKRWGERLLFCAAEAPDHVFGVTMPCPPEQSLVSHWRAAIEAEQFGRMVMHTQSLTGAEEMDSVFLIIHQGDGARWIREWCGGQWMKTRPTRPPLVPVWHPDWKTPRFSTVPNETLKELLARPFSEEERPEQPFIWLRGSRRELKQIVEACITLRLFSPRLMDIQGEWHKERGDRFYYFAHAPFFPSWMYGYGRQAWYAPEPWDTLLRCNFVGAGWHWARRKNKNELLREGWKVAPSIQTTALQVSLSPSQHERLEAMVVLRDWLRERVGVSDERVAELLR